MMDSKIIDILKKMKEEERSKLIEEVPQGEYTHGDRAEALNFAIFMLEDK